MRITVKDIARPRIIFIPEFGQGEGGGNQRSSQLAADIAKVFGETKSLDISYHKKKAEWLMAVALLPVVWYKLRTYNLTTLGWLRACSLYKILRKDLAQKREVLFLIEGFHSVFLILGILIRESREQYITFPQNIEFMVPGSHNKHFRTLEGRFRAEISLYRGAIRNVTISEFDRAIIETFSANACTYPFYPIEERLRFLRKVKTARRGSPGREVLILGTTLNVPVRMAVEDFLRKVSGHKCGEFKINVAGLGTEKLCEYASSEITIMGTISAEKLAQVLASAYCVLVPVLQTTGFMTRLVDMNLAGIPVVIFGNYLQARNLKDYGIYFAERIEDLSDVLDKIEPPRREFAPPRFKDVLGESWAADQ
ncbi:hypothetical protein ACFLS5_02465 [Candidatus Bipolaricaulota bacterium]